MSDQETREKRLARRKRKQKEWSRRFPDFRRRAESAAAPRTFEGNAHQGTEWDHGDDLFHDPTDGDIRELNFHDDDEV